VDRREVWEQIVWTLEQKFTSGEFDEGEFRVANNPAMRSITIIENSTSQAFMLLDVTGATFGGGRNPGDAIVVQLPVHHSAKVLGT